MVSEDANFKMKGRATSTRAKDPTLGPGWACMVASDSYLEHLAKYIDQDEVRSISNCKGSDLANDGSRLVIALHLQRCGERTTNA